MNLLKRNNTSVREARKIWEEHCRQIETATSDGVANETNKEKEKRIKSLQKDYAAFVNYYFPHFVTCKPAPFHIDAANKIKNNKTLKGVFEWARGHAKSVTFNVFVPMWLMANKDMKVMLLVSKTKDKASTLLSDLQAELQFNKRFIADFGEQFAHGDWQEGSFTTKQGHSFFAFGLGQSPRGTRKGAFRPDLIVVDDADDDKTCRNNRLVDEIIEWIKSALFGALDMGRGRFIIVGNRIAKNSIIAKLAEEKSVYHTKVNVKDDKGNIAWAAKYTHEEIEIAEQFMGYIAAQKELYNNPILAGKLFKKEWIVLEKPTQQILNDLQEIVCYTDPSFKATKTSDYKASVLMGITSNSKFWILEAFVRQCDMNELIAWHYNILDKYAYKLPNSQTVIKFYMEANFAQDTLLENYLIAGEELGYTIPMRKDLRQKPDKYARIENLTPVFERCDFIFSEHLLNNEDFKRGKEHLLAFEKSSSSADDFPDAIEGAYYLLRDVYRKTKAMKIPTIYIKRQRTFRRR